MFEKRIALNNIDEKMEFVNVAAKVGCDVDLRSGSKCVDAKSELGVVGFNGEIGRMKVRVHSDNPNDINAFKKWFV